MDITQINIVAIFCGTTVEVGKVDVDHCNLISTINDVLEVIENRHKLDDEQFNINVVVPWSKDRLLLDNDNGFMKIISKTLDKGFDRLLLEINVRSLRQKGPTQRILYHDLNPTPECGIDDKANDANDIDDEFPVSQVT